jgi:ATP-dependent DNA helicase RecQ
LRGEESFPYRPDAAPQPRGTRPKGDTPAKPTAAQRQEQEQELSERDLELLAELKTLRSSLSQARNVPAYVVFSDRSLLDMAKTRPASEAEFANIHGVGQAKLKKFAAPFLAVIAEHG